MNKEHFSPSFHKLEVMINKIITQKWWKIEVKIFWPHLSTIYLFYNLTIQVPINNNSHNFIQVLDGGYIQGISVVIESVPNTRKRTGNHVKNFSKTIFMKRNLVIAHHPRSLQFGENCQIRIDNSLHRFLIVGEQVE